MADIKLIKKEDEYEKILKRIDEIFEADGTKKGNPELLLWIPPANKYYNAGSRSVFERCEGYSKTLVFSSWEMVPRALSTLVSYESERLVNKKII